MDLLDRLLTIIQEQSTTTYIAGGAAIIVSYLALVHMIRFRYINALRRKYPDPTLPLRDAKVAEEIFDTTFRYDFPCNLSRCAAIGQAKSINSCRHCSSWSTITGIGSFQDILGTNN